MTSFDIIGDIHGHAQELEELLGKLGYLETDGVFRHPDGRKAVFLGDYIDRGPEIRRSLQIVRSMVDAGNAYAIMGNHELNALHYMTADPLSQKSDKFLRSHSEAHKRQFKETVRQLGKKELSDALVWMAKLPVWLILKDDCGETLRFIHAAWHQPYVEMFYRAKNGAGIPVLTGPFEKPHFTPAGILSAGRRRDPVSGENSLAYKMKNILISGPETKLPDGYSYFDKDGNERTSFRLRWWKTPNENTRLADMLMAGEKACSELRKSNANIHFDTARFKPYPVMGFTFFGHYWLDCTEAAPITNRIACLDLSVARGGALAAYRYESGDKKLYRDRFVTVTAVDNK